MAKRLSLALLFAASITAQQLPPTLLNELHWRNIGPIRGGRTRAAAGVPSQPNVFYMGVCNGGVWKSDDYGRTWNPLFDAQPTQSIGAIAVAPSDPNIVYVASGEGLQRPDLSVGDGIYKSIDAGRTWQHLGLRNSQQIPALIIDPRDPNHLFAAVLGHPYGPNEERGIFTSRDGGVTWQRSLYIDANTGGSDVVFDPANANTLYAGMWEGRQGPWEFDNGYTGTHGGLYKSTDGGRTWNKLTNGLPANSSQTYITVSPANPRRVYATIAAGPQVNIYRSDNAGDSWTVATTDPRPTGRIGGGDLPMPRVDPRDPDTLYSTSTVTWRSNDAGKTWTAIKGAPGGDDYQNMWINPTNPDIILLVADQGAVVSTNRGRTWSSWYNQSTAQMYHAIATSDFPYKVCGGQQESGSVCVSSRGNDGAIGPREWHPVGIIEYGYAAPDPLNPDLVYGAGRGSVTRHRISTGQTQTISPAAPPTGAWRVDRTSPIIFSPTDPHVLFYAANVVFKSINGGETWQTISPDLTRDANPVPPSLGTLAAADANAPKQRGVVYSLAPSPKSLQILWAGTDEGLIHVTRDGGLHWSQVTPPGIEPWSKVTQLEAGHFDTNTAYASISRLRVDDQSPLLFRTHDGGKSWTRITEGLPNSPVDTIREDPVRKGLLYAGTETAVWFSLDDGDHWQSLQLNLPHTSMRDLWIKDADLIVGTHGRGFWILDGLTPLRQLEQTALEAPVWLPKPAPAWRVRDNTNTDTPAPPDEPAGENPPDGAIIDYYLKERADLVTLDILDSAGKLVRRYTSADAPEISVDAIRELAIPTWWPQRPRTLSAAPGLHRWIWDLHAFTVEAMRYEYPIAAVPGRTPRLPKGPIVLPGVYTLKLTASGKTVTAPLTVRMDPRVRTILPGLRQQFQLQSSLAHVITASTGAIKDIGSALEQSAERNSPALTAAFVQSVRDLQSRLTRANGQSTSLYNNTGSADVPPTPSQQAAGTKLARDLAPLLAQWDTQLKAVNQKLKAAGLEELRIQQRKESETEVADDDRNEP